MKTILIGHLPKTTTFVLLLLICCTEFCFAAQGKNKKVNSDDVFSGLQLEKQGSQDKQNNNQNTATKFLCIADKATGFKYSKLTNEYESVNFNVNDEKFIVSPTKGIFYKYTITKIGQKSFAALCKGGINKYGFLFCGGMFSEFKINTQKGRYLQIYSVGYYTNSSGKYKNADTPFIEIGKCSPF